MAQSQLLERESVTAAVGRLLDRAGNGSGGALFIVGEAGLGKTSVLDNACEGAADTFETGFGRGEAMEGFLPFGLALQAFQSLDLADLVATVNSTTASVVEPSAPYYKAMRWLQDRGERPLLLALDDLHWSDADSMTLIAFLARRLERLPVALVGTLRPWPSGTELVCRDLADAGHASLEYLNPLTRAATGALLEERTGKPVSEGLARRVWELCRGTPLLVEQVAAAIDRGEQIPETGETPSGLGAQLVLGRFAGLNRTGVRCAAAASVLGTSFRPELATEVAELQPGEVDGALESLFRSGLVVETGDGMVRFAHPLFAQAMYEDLAPVLRRRIHARCFASLARRGLDAEAAEHAVRADMIGDPMAVAVLERAGRAALRAGAVAVATTRLDAAVRFSADRPPTDLLFLHAEALISAGRAAAAGTVCRRLLAEADLSWSDRVELLRTLGRASYLSGSADHGELALEEAVAIALAKDPLRAVPPLLDRSLSAWLAGGPAKALPLAAQARAIAAGGDEELCRRTDATWGHLALESGNAAGLDATRSVGRIIVDGPDRQLDPAELVWPWASVYNVGLNAVEGECFDEAERAFTLAREVAEAAGAANALATLAIYRANLFFRRGRLQDALGEADRAREFADLTPGVVAYAALVMAEALVWLGRLDESKDWCAQAEAGAPGQWFAELWLAHVQGLRLLWEGDDGASSMFLAAERLTNASGIREPCHVHWAGHAVTAHLNSGRADDALRVVEWLESCAETIPCRWPRIVAALGRGQLAWVDHDDASASDAFDQALALHQQVDLPLQRIETLLLCGGFRRRRGTHAEARALIAEALELAEDIGAAWLARAARTELGAAGGRRRRRTPGSSLLTSAEQGVMVLAAAGCSNAEIARRLFVSVNTVETHLKHIYAKLGIKSRRELIRTHGRAGSTP